VRAKTIAAFLAATAIVGACAVPAFASAAKPHRERQKPSVSTDLKMRGTHGFRVDLFTLDGSDVFLIADRRASSASVNYISLKRHPRKAFDAGRLDVKVGHLGHFRGRFVPTSTEEEKLEPGCEGDRPTVEKGFFVGSFDFRGERGYTAVHSHRLRGSVTHRPGGICTFSDGPAWHESPHQAKVEKERRRNELHLVAADEKESVLFQARSEEATKDEPPQTNFQASINGRRVGDFQVSYFATDFGFEAEPEAIFQVPNLAEPLAEATVAPSAPFSGSATFHLDSPKTASWTGDLAVEMPGLGKVPLTGAGIDAGLCKGLSCTKTLPKDLQPVLEAPSGVIVAVTVSKPKRDR
jgi:hypothetical protein